MWNGSKYLFLKSKKNVSFFYGGFFVYFSSSLAVRFFSLTPQDLSNDFCEASCDLYD